MRSYKNLSQAGRGLLFATLPGQKEPTSLPRQSTAKGHRRKQPSWRSASQRSPQSLGKDPEGKVEDSFGDSRTRRALHGSARRCTMLHLARTGVNLCTAHKTCPLKQRLSAGAPGFAWTIVVIAGSCATCFLYFGSQAAAVTCMSWPVAFVLLTVAVEHEEKELSRDTIPAIDAQIWVLQPPGLPNFPLHQGNCTS